MAATVATTMENSGGRNDDHPLYKKMMNLKTTDDEDPYLLSIPPDVQKIILSQLGCEELLQMRATNIYYRDKISRHCQDIWNLRIASLWLNGKGAMNGKNIEFMKWSRANNFNVHRANMEITGFEEFVRRRRLDNSVFARLQQLDFGCKGEDRRVIVGGIVHTVKGLDENADNTNWITLMEDGEDIIDCLRHIITSLGEYSDRNYFSHSKVWKDQPQSSGTKHKKSRIERLCYESECDPLKMIVNCKRVLNGIYRLHSYQQWKYLNEMKTELRLIETGASVVAKFFLTISRSSPDKTRWQLGLPPQMTTQDPHTSDPYLFDNVDEEIDSSLCEFTNVIKSSLEKRLGRSANFPLLEVIQEMQTIFGDDSPNKFRGNTTNYYDAKNSLLHEVLTRKTGIPITLAIVYTAIVRRVSGAHLHLIGLPGHIVLGLPFEEGTPLAERMFVDVFHGGEHLSHSDLKSIVAQYGLTWSDEMANPISHQEVWQRMIRNLMHCHSEVSLHDEFNVRVLMTLQCLIDPRMCIETFQKMILAPGFSAYTC
mmetsp:Transcript_16095/g.27178  ORF Transcript_16095/g.27178 Transcript_16095/m.27178 type:complete len:539 (-) Transcript_16095:51-1667(-)